VRKDISLAAHTGHKPKKKGRSPWVDEFRDPKTMISTENHMQLFHRLIKAGEQGIHNHPGPPKPKKSG
jgi:hypothetical protein